MTRRRINISYQLQIVRTHLRAGLVHLYNCWSNGKDLGEKATDILKVTIPIIAWLILFNVVGIIPHGLKPNISVRLLPRLDQFVFDDNHGSIISNICLVIGGYLLHQRNEKECEQDHHRVINGENPLEQLELAMSREVSDKLGMWNEEGKDMDSMVGEKVEGDRMEGDRMEGDRMKGDRMEGHQKEGNKMVGHKMVDHKMVDHIPVDNNMTHNLILNPKTLYLLIPKIPITSAHISHISQLTPILTTLFGWVIVKFLDEFSDSHCKAKTIIAIVFYILGHFILVPILLVYMYLFHPSSVLKQFVIVMGIQNFLITLTHFMLPNVPPIFIQYYGENKIPNYDLPGYSEGLTRLQMFQTNFVFDSLIYYVKATDFGIIPSLHSCMAILTINYLMDLLTFKVIKLALMIYLGFQLWSSLYLAHHWKLDLLFSFIYSNIIYVMSKYKGNHPMRSTMGMRLFEHSKLRDWFNPYLNE